VRQCSDIDAIVDGPASAEANAVDDLIETIPTTMAGLLSLLIHLAKARRRDPEMFCEQHLEPLINGRGKAGSSRAELIPFLGPPVHAGGHTN
jgi:hypothetical protein